MSNRIYIAPAKYVQGPGVLNSLGTYVETYGKNFLVIADETVWEIV